ncbi:unnamed protein product [Urochloa humidicola]
MPARDVIASASSPAPPHCSSSSSPSSLRGHHPPLGLILPEQPAIISISLSFSSPSGHGSPNRAEPFPPADSPATSNQTQIARIHYRSTSPATPSSIPEPRPSLVLPGIQGFAAAHCCAISSSTSTLTSTSSLPPPKIQPKAMARTSMPTGCCGSSSKDAENPLLPCALGSRL